MIMSGTTPRLLGLWGTLGALGLAAVLLPVNASIAQNSDEKKELRIIVKSDDDALAEASAATIVGAPVEILTVGVGEGENADAEKFHFEFKTDSSSDKVTADSLDEAIAKINEKIKEIEKSSDSSEPQKARKKALERVVKELESHAKKGKELKAIAQKEKLAKELKRVVVRKVEQDKKLSAEQKAEIDSLRAKVKDLADSLQAKHRELAEARTKLAKLEGAARSMAVLRVNPQVEQKIVRLRELPRIETISPGQMEHRVIVDRKADADQKRIDQLEKKLDELLKEVAKLKKDRAQ
jgi:hypothetical protein